MGAQRVGGVALHASPSRTLYSSDLVTFGTFRIRPDHPGFRDAGAIGRPNFVFPRRSVVIQHEGGREFVAPPSVVTYYNTAQAYVRKAIDPEGDACDWFEVRPDVLADVVSVFDAGARERPDAPFPFAYAKTDDRAYLLQRLLVRRAATNPEGLDQLLVEEVVFRVLWRVLVKAFDRPRTAVAQTARTRGLVEHLKHLLARCYHVNTSLRDLAHAVGCSPFHLARAFGSIERTSVHEFRNRLRLCRSLELLEAPGDLSALAVGLGFYSHSHFGAAFRKAYGVTPSAFRRHAPKPSLRPKA